MIDWRPRLTYLPAHSWWKAQSDMPWGERVTGYGATMLMAWLAWEGHMDNAIKSRLLGAPHLDNPRELANMGADIDIVARTVRAKMMLRAVNMVSSVLASTPT